MNPESSGSSNIELKVRTKDGIIDTPEGR